MRLHQTTMPIITAPYLLLLHIIAKKTDLDSLEREWEVIVIGDRIEVHHEPSTRPVGHADGHILGEVNLSTHNADIQTQTTDGACASARAGNCACSCGLTDGQD